MYIKENTLKYVSIKKIIERTYDPYAIFFVYFFSLSKQTLSNDLTYQLICKVTINKCYNIKSMAN